MKRGLLAFLLLVFAASPVGADVAAGVEAFRRGNYEAALEAWKPMAEAGDPVAQFNIGILYRGGLGVPPDNGQAIGWFERAAVGGHTTAQLNLGLIYEQGIGIPADRTAALRWYRRAAKENKTNGGFEEARARAQFRLADLLLRGDSVNRSAGMYWLQQSGASGHAEAQFRLALAYAAGEDLVRDSAEAAHWFERAAEQGHLGAQVNLATIYETGVGLRRDEAKAVHWYTQAAKQNAVVAQITLGSLYAQGRGVAQDDRAALQWYSRAANQGARDAHFNLGVLYEHSTELADDRKAYFWYAVAAKAGHKQAGLRLVSLRDKIGNGDAAAIERRAALWRPQKARAIQTPEARGTKE